jgi:hypothetical protein
LLIAVVIGLALSGGGWLSLSGALLVGILAASLVCQVREGAAENTMLGAFGELALVILLTETDLTLGSLRPLLGSLAAGGGLGLLLGYIGARIALRLPVGAARNRFCLGLNYAAYLVGVLPPWGVPGVSAVLLTAATALVMAIYGYRVGLRPTITALPVVFNRRGMALLMAETLLVLGWQAHVPITGERAVGFGLGLVAAAFAVLAGRWLVSGAGEAVRPALRTLLRTEGRVFLLLLGILWLWPQEAVVAPGTLALALLVALLAVGLLYATRGTIFDLVGMEHQ